MKGEKRMELFWSSYSPSGKARVRQSSTEDMGGQPSGPIKRQAQGQSMTPLLKVRQWHHFSRSGNDTTSQGQAMSPLLKFRQCQIYWEVVWQSLWTLVRFFCLKWFPTKVHLHASRWRMWTTLKCRLLIYLTKSLAQLLYLLYLYFLFFLKISQASVSINGKGMTWQMNSPACLELANSSRLCPVQWRSKFSSHSLLNERQGTPVLYPAHLGQLCPVR